MYALIALFGDSSKPLFILCALVILSFYGGGFATIPAYLKDLFGTYQVGAIHGRLLTAWSTAGVLGPLIVNWIADRQEEAGRHGASLYGLSFVIMIGLLVVGFVANELVRPVHPRHHIPAPREDRRCRQTTAVRVRLTGGVADRLRLAVGGRAARLRAVRTRTEGDAAVHRVGAVRPGADRAPQAPAGARQGRCSGVRGS